jgi:hypothetical protein
MLHPSVRLLFAWIPVAGCLAAQTKLLPPSPADYGQWETLAEEGVGEACLQQHLPENYEPSLGCASLTV